MAKRTTDRLRVATLNIFGHYSDWARRRPILIDGFRELRPDVIALQEVVKNDTYNQAADVLGESYHFVHLMQGNVDDRCHAIASRWPIRNVREEDLNVPSRIETLPSFALVAEIVAPEPFGPVLFCTYPSEYRPSFELERERQAVATARLLESLVGDQQRHVIVAGDMNADPDSASMRFWTGRQSLDGVSVGYRDAWESIHLEKPGLTFTPENPLMADANRDWPFRQIDHVLVRCSTHGLPTLDITACERIFVEPVDGITASDHYGVMADIAVPPGPEPS